MKKTIDQITDHFVGLIKSDKPHYNPKELLRSGLPSFVVERIRLYLEDKVREESEKQKAVWFDPESKLVAEAREDYIRACMGASHIPRENLYEVIHKIIQDVVFVFIEPRKKMADYLFRDDEILDYEELSARCEQLTIYKHFGTAIPLYMKKRELTELSKERCQLLIQQLDAKLVASYRPQDWVQKLDQLFVLFGGSVDPRLLVIFFKDKGMDSMVALFDELDKALDKSEFIRILTGEKQPSPKKKEKSSQTGVAKDHEDSTLIESFFGNYEQEAESSLADIFKGNSLTDDEMSDLLTSIANDGVIEVEDLDPVESLNELFIMRTQEDDGVSQTAEEIADELRKREGSAQDENNEFRENLISILSQAKHSFDGIEDEDEPDDHEQQLDEDEADLATEDDSGDEPSTPASSGQDEEAQPMWSQFLNKDQMDVIMGGKRQKPDPLVTTEAEATEDEDDFITISDSFTENIVEEDASAVPGLSEVLKSRKSEFIETIFGGSEDQYKEAIEEIEGFNEWKETSAYIQNKIFKKNEVDMLDGATVDFTDRLHTYFNERRST